MEIDAIELDETGAGVGRASDGTEVHAWGLLPGERGTVQVEHRSPHRAVVWGRATARATDSPDRVTPACPGWGDCGGCGWQHLGYEAQLREKQRRVARALGRDVPAVVPAPAQLGYRNKGKYVVGPGHVLGAYAPRSHRVVGTLGCRIVAPVIDEVARAARVACEGLAVYDERTRAGELRYVIVRADDAGGVLVILVIASGTRADALASVAATLAAHPSVRGVVAMRNDRTDGALVTDDTTVLVGRGFLVEPIAGCPIEVGAGEFLQVNRDQARALYARVAALAGTGHVADVYAGLGGIALTCARAGARVDAIEADPRATAALARAAAAGGLAVNVITADASAVRDLAADVIVVDPPRKGLGAALPALLSANPARIVYVSCGPESLGKDLAALAPAYAVASIEPYDLMPGTAQVETIVHLTRS